MSSPDLNLAIRFSYLSLKQQRPAEYFFEDFFDSELIF